MVLYQSTLHGRLLYTFVDLFKCTSSNEVVFVCYCFFVDFLLLSFFRSKPYDSDGYSQLIVIRHQKRTVDIADALYGVTMRDGVTTVVSQRLAD